MPIGGEGDEPVRALVVEASGTPAGVGEVDRIEQACRTGERFAVLIDARRAAGAGREMAGRDRRVLLGRLRSLRGELKARCAGVAFLTAPVDGGEGEGEGEARRLRAAGLLFGCPVGTVGSLDAARDWLGARGATVPGEIQP